LKAVALAFGAVLLSACSSLPWRAPHRSEIVIAAWTEPARLPRGGGSVAVLVRVQRVGGGPYPGVQVRLQTNTGALQSSGRPLVTDEEGMTRDVLRAKKPAEVVVRAADTRYRFKVAMAGS
jgi:hypothetical protein